MVNQKKNKISKRRGFRLKGGSHKVSASNSASNFKKKLKEIRPDWFQNHTKIRKNKLLQLAKSGVERPNQKKHPLGYNLSSYTSPKSTCFDKEFTKKLKTLANHWFKK